MRRQSLQRQLPRLEGAHASARLHFTSGFWVTLGLLACLHGCDSDDTKKDDSPSTRADGGDSEADAATQPSMDAGKGSDGGTDTGSAQAGEPLTTTITIASGPIQGEAAQEAGKQVLIFRGVPYAAAPTGALRWKPPQPVAAWTSPRDATKWGDRCPQGESTLSSPGAMSEDCLNLNVLTPAAKSSERLPVMVFFHGGGLSVGTGNSSTYCHTALPAQGVVAVGERVAGADAQAPAVEEHHHRPHWLDLAAGVST